MSARKLPRDTGVRIACDAYECTAVIRTANVLIRVNRKNASTTGWGRGLFAGGKRRDLCPVHFAIELDRRKSADEKRWLKMMARDEKRMISPPAKVEVTSQLQRGAIVRARNSRRSYCGFKTRARSDDRARS